MLIEKPVGLNVEAVEQMVSAARAASVQIMDAVHWMHNPRTPRFMGAVRASVGERRRVSSAFCFPGHRREGFFTDTVDSMAGRCCATVLVPASCVNSLSDHYLP